MSIMRFRTVWGEAEADDGDNEDKEDEDDEEACKMRNEKLTPLEE